MIYIIVHFISSGDVHNCRQMMTLCGDADGMVSGAMHTTAATIRPGLQVLRTKDSPLVSSVFFMCLPDKVCPLALASPHHDVLKYAATHCCILEGARHSLFHSCPCLFLPHAAGFFTLLSSVAASSCVACVYNSLFLLCWEVCGGIHALI